MLQRDVRSSTVVLGSDDLELLQRFLEAWCDENGVDITNQAAIDVASALIDWYQFDLDDRNLMKSELPENLPESIKIQQLLRKLNEA